MGRVGQIQAVQANLRYPDSVAAAVRDADVVINLVGILFERGRQRFDDVQAAGAGNGGARRGAAGAPLIHVSAIGADENSPSRYARSKADGERLVLAAQTGRSSCGRRSCSGPKTTSSTASPRWRASRRRCRCRAAAIPACSRCSPATSAKRSPRRSTAIQAGTIYELGGPDVRTFKELMEFVLATIERRRLLVPVPFALMKLQAAFLQFLPKPPITPDQVELLKHDNVVSDAARATAARSKGSASCRSRSPRSCRLICGASARPASSARTRRKSLQPQRQRDEPERADHDPPPGEQRKAVARDVAEQRLDHEPAADEGHRKADGDDREIAGAAAGELVLF
jgi:uncharacterized protein YbjT (DUF2867 family)